MKLKSAISQMFKEKALSEKPKVFILQRVIPSYRVRVFEYLTSDNDCDVTIVIGENKAGEKAQNAANLSQISTHKLPTKTFEILGRTFVLHRGLLRYLMNEKPSHIISEAESHFLGYLTVIFYKMILNRSCKTYLWCFYSLPGRPHERSAFHSLVKKVTRATFDGFVSYTSFGRHFLMSKGINENAISVATNVCDTDKFMSLAESLKLSKEEAKEALSVDGKFVVSFFGTLTEVKKPHLILQLAEYFRNEDIVFRIIGKGPLEKKLKEDAARMQITNLYFDGHVSNDIAVYYRASDVVLVPGRGGIVISEAMSFGVPVIVHEADGVELDLIVEGESGVIVPTATLSSFVAPIKELHKNKEKLLSLSHNASTTIRDHFNTKNMATHVLRLIK